MRSTAARSACSRRGPMCRRPVDLRANLQARAGLHPDASPATPWRRRSSEAPRRGAERGRLRARALLVVSRRGRGAASSDPIEDEGEALDALEQVLARGDPGPVGGRRAGRRLPVGRDRFSSTVVALYQKYSPNPVRTFSIGFEEAGFNEAEHAKAVAAHLGTVHTNAMSRSRRRATSSRCFRRCTTSRSPIPRKSRPISSAGSRASRSRSRCPGDGGDELFAGYNRHFMAPRLWQQPAEACRGRARR